MLRSNATDSAAKLGHNLRKRQYQPLVHYVSPVSMPEEAGIMKALLKIFVHL